MSRFLKKRLESLEAYTPGEQPQDKKYIKLNTNESPFPPDEYVISKAKDAAAGFNVYNDPECSRLREKAAELYGVDKEKEIREGIADILKKNGMEIRYLAVEQGKESIPVSAAFPQIYERRNMVNVTI